MRRLVGLSLLSVLAVALLVQRGGQADIYRFNFAPQEAPEVAAFTKVSAVSDYDSGRGYGWLDATGDVASGSWYGADSGSWEARDNLNILSRQVPDELARSLASGPATFVLDLPPGNYEVWVLSGDAGYLEYVPHEPYRVLVEGVTAHEFSVSADEFYRRFETPVRADDSDLDGVWSQSIEPRFRWSRARVAVQDGQLDVRVDGPPRDARVYDYIGDYAYTDVRKGPSNRYSGALNALVVLPASEDAARGEQLIEAIDRWRRQDFADKWPLRVPESESVAEFTAADRKRGYTVFQVHPQQPLGPGEQRSHRPAPLLLRATPGEYVPLSFGICPLQELGDTRISFQWLPNDPGSDRSDTPVDTGPAPGVVRYVARPTRRGDQSWWPAPGMIIPTDSWHIGRDVARQFWMTYHVAEDMTPGHYRGLISIQPEHGEVVTLEVALEVLPFRLQRPVHLAVGMTYFSPVQYSYFGEQRFWERIAAEFADMRAHNMTTVQYTGLRMDDHERIGKAFELYREAGFEQPVYLLESYGLLSRLRRNGLDWESRAFDTEYVRLLGEFLQQADVRGWPPLIVNFGDEFTNTATEEVGARLARSLKTIPGIVTGADANGYKEVRLMAPEVDIVAFNNGWDGPAGVNQGRKLLNGDTVELVRQAGAIPWLVNVGIDRFTNGFWFWKMARLGIRGKVEWMYGGYYGMPYNSFDARPMHGDAAYPGPDGSTVPSIGYELMRIGLDDLAYLHTLELALVASRELPEKQQAVERAEAFIAGLDAMIEDDLNLYREPNTRQRHAWPVERFDALRNEAIDLILQLQQ